MTWPEAFFCIGALWLAAWIAFARIRGFDWPRTLPPNFPEEEERLEEREQDEPRGVPIPQETRLRMIEEYRARGRSRSWSERAQDQQFSFHVSDHSESRFEEDTSVGEPAPDRLLDVTIKLASGGPGTPEEELCEVFIDVETYPPKVWTLRVDEQGDQVWEEQQQGPGPRGLISLAFGDMLVNALACQVPNLAWAVNLIETMHKFGQNRDTCPVLLVEWYDALTLRQSRVLESAIDVTPLKAGKPTKKKTRRLDLG